MSDEMVTIEAKYPQLTDTGGYVLFKCTCGARNGTTIHEQSGVPVVVCGSCWKITKLGEADRER